MKNIFIELGDNDLSRMRLKLEQCLIQNNCTYKMIENGGYNIKEPKETITATYTSNAEEESQKEHDCFGTITLIWEDGYTKTKDIFSTIRGIKHNGKRFKNYTLKLKDNFSLIKLDQITYERIFKWIQEAVDVKE